MSTLFSGHYLRNRSTLDIGVLGYIGIVQHEEHSPEVLSIPPGTPVYRVIQEESVRLREMIVCVILSKKVDIIMGPILNGYGVTTV